MKKKTNSSLFSFKIEKNFLDIFFSANKLFFIFSLLIILIAFDQYSKYKFAEGTIKFRDKQLSETRNEIKKLELELSNLKSQCQ